MIHKTIAVFQHHPAEGVGRMALWAKQHSIELECFYAPESLLENLDAYRGLIILGGPMNVVDNPVWMQTESRLIKQALTQQVPLLAICLGAQLLAIELGGQVIDMPNPELGWHEVTFADGTIMAVPQWHYQAINLPDSIVSLARSAQCNVQMYHHQKAIGLQFHPEWNSAQIGQLVSHFGDECPVTNTPHTHAMQDTLEPFFFKLLTEHFC
jgi:GMP synthase-like glutamine amidotransferase